MIDYPDRRKYLEAVQKQLEPNIFKHSLALEACMGGLYDYYNNNGQLTADEPTKNDWLLAGLIHDIDFAGETKPYHPTKTLEALQKYGLTISETVHNIVKAHAPSLTGRQQQNKAEWSIFCADSLTGLIIAVAFVMPTRKLVDVKLSSVLKRFRKEPKFAAGTRRTEIILCEKPEGLNLTLDKFTEVCLTSMQRIAMEIGL